jgi:hypothetical protein
MRMLLMISNQQMSLRERYTTVLDTHPIGWITSFMSGMPGEAEAIVTGYDAVIFELGAPDREERVHTTRRLLATGVPVLTHLEGRLAAHQGSELAEAGAIVIPMPLTSEHIQTALDELATRLRKDHHSTPKLSVRGFFHRLLHGA